MRLLAGRLISVSRVVACSAVVFSLELAAACSPDSPSVVSPANVDTPFEVLDLSAGSVLAQVKSAWLSSQCMTIRNGSMYDGARVELQPCTGGVAQQFEFTTTGDIKIASTYCLDAYSGQGKTGDRVVIWGCHGGENQKWMLTSAGEIKGINGLCISFNGHPNDGTTLFISTCKSTADQKWIEAGMSGPVAPPAAPASIAIALTAGSLSVGQTAQATATVKDSSGNTRSGQEPYPVPPWRQSPLQASLPRLRPARRRSPAIRAASQGARF